MCGIAGVYRKTDSPVGGLNVLTVQLMLAMEGRGRDATGYVAIDDEGGVQLEKICVPASRFVGKKRRIRHDARSVLIHTRYATTGRKKATEDAHPQQSGSVYCVHNGTIWNDDELFREWGMDRRCQVDSEVIPALVSQVSGWGDIAGAMELLAGGAAVALANTDHPREVVLARTRSFPVCWAETDNFVIWASTTAAIREAWKKAYGRFPAKDRIRTLPEGKVLRIRERETSIEEFTVLDPVVTHSSSAATAWEWDDDLRAWATKGHVQRALPAAPVETSGSEAWDRAAAAAASWVGDENAGLGPYDDMLDSVEWDMADGAAILLTEERCDDCGGFSTMCRFRWDSVLCPDCYDAMEESMLGIGSNVIPIAAGKRR